MEKDYEGDKSWITNIRVNEVFKGLGAASAIEFFLSLPQSKVIKNKNKIFFLYKYLMGFRSRFSHFLSNSIKHL